MIIKFYLLFFLQLDALMGSLNVKGIREKALKRQLEKFYNKIRCVISKNLTVGHY